MVLGDDDAERLEGRVPTWRLGEEPPAEQVLQQAAAQLGQEHGRVDPGGCLGEPVDRPVDRPGLVHDGEDFVDPRPVGEVVERGDRLHDLVRDDRVGGWQPLDLPAEPEQQHPEGVLVGKRVLERPDRPDQVERDAFEGAVGAHWASPRP